MARDPVDELLREWGQAQLGRHEAHDQRRRDNDPGSHPISKARQFEMSRKTFAKQVVTRGGLGRRTMMAQAAGVPGMRMVPAYAVDPIRCVETRHVGPGLSGDTGGMPKHLKAVDRAAMELYREHKLMGLCLRLEFTARGFQSDKATMVNLAMENELAKPLTTRTYRENLMKAKLFIRGRMSNYDF